MPTSESSDANMIYKGLGVVALGFVGYYIYKKFTPSPKPTQASLPSRDRHVELVSHREKENNLEIDPFKMDTKIYCL